MSGPLVVLEGVEHQYASSGPRWRVDQLRLHPGQCATLTGPSGSGKTTLLELIAGIQVPRSGHIAVCGVPWSETSPQQRQAHRLQHLGLVFQGFELFAALTAWDNLLLPARLLKLDPGAARERALALAQRVGLEPLLGRKPARLSHGERQRIALCRALVHQPRLLLADEPSANLDREHSVLITALLQEHIASGGALILVSHDEALLDAWRENAIAWSMADFRQPAGERP